MNSSEATTPDSAAQRDSAEQPAGEVIESDSLIEEVSIDGMCGVY